ncbi:MAG: hypothetical protein ABUT39_03355 [Acidobacteriota bacterium]
MRRLHLLSLLCLAASAGFSVFASAQPLPVGPEIQVNTYTQGLQGVSGVASDAAGNVVVAWESGFPPSPPPTQDGDGAGVFVRRLSPTGAPLSGEIPVNVSTAGDQFIPTVAMTPEGDFVVTWISQTRDGAGTFHVTTYGRLFAADGSPKGGEFRLSTSDGYNEYYPATSYCPDGGFVAVWQRFLPNGDDSDVLARWFDPSGAPRGAEVVVSSEDYPTNGYPDVACDLHGRTIVVWEACCDLGAEQADIRLLRFDPDGDPIGAEVPVETAPGRTFDPSLAVAPDGSFAVAWDTYNQAWARRFGPDGAPTGPPWKVSTPGALPGAFEGSTDVLLDAAGNLLVTWTSEGRDGSDYGVYGVWYDRSGTARGGLFRLNTTTALDQGGARVALQPGGFLAAWTSGRYNGPGQDGDQWGVIAQRFVIPPSGADPCILGEDGLACDLLHDGGGAELSSSFARSGDTPLLGNLDGDSRDDLCVYRNGRFLCDLAHDGGTAEAEIAFGVAGDIPLLGDVNGDGRDDACVRRGRRFACDTRHNGGTAEVQIVFGRVTDAPLLGDVDGDGDDDPCLFRGDRFHCDTVHDGRGPEVVLFFGQPGDTPLLGDVDGDGRDDACVFRLDRFLCDTAHDGGAAEVEILFGEAGSIPILGNVNGF